jgi:hypothetical protein
VKKRRQSLSSSRRSERGETTVKMRGSGEWWWVGVVGVEYPMGSSTTVTVTVTETETESGKVRLCH